MPRRSGVNCWRPALCLWLFALLAGCVSQQRLEADQIAATSAAVHKQTTIALLGGTGMVGGHILKQALAQGYPLRVLSRSPQKLAYLQGRVTVIEGDARDPQVIARLVEGSDVVVSAIGPGANADPGLNSRVSANVLAAISSAASQRYLVVSGAGVSSHTDQRNITGWMIRLLARLRYGELLRDRQAEYAMLAASVTDWTLLRRPLIDGGASGSAAKVSLNNPGQYRLSAEALAHFILQEVASPNYSRAAPFVFGGMD